ncbi:DGAT2 acyltransferase, partial [Atractosteus spatula]|nr:DGAT2 acyltransferase [Atractosteus spatula]
MGISCTVLMLYLIFTSLWLLSVLYFIWMVIDWDTPERGGRRSDWIRNWSVWKHIRDYYPVTLNPHLTVCVSHSLNPCLTVCVSQPQSPSHCLCVSQPQSPSHCLCVSQPQSLSHCLCVSASIPVSLSVCLSLNPHLIVCVSQPQSPSHCLCVSLSQSPSHCLCVSQPKSLSHCLSHSLNSCLTVCVSQPKSLFHCLCLTASIPISLSVCLTASIPFSLSVCLSLNPRLTVCVSHCLNPCLTVCVSHCLNPCLTVSLSVGCQLMKTAELSPSKNFVLGYHPHGIMCAGAFSCFSTEGAGFSAVFPGIQSHLATLAGLFRLPLYRDYLMSSGMIPVSKPSLEFVLSRSGTGHAVVIVVGGAAESLNCTPGLNVLVMRERKGFVRLALEYGADLVPVYSFGENEIFEQFVFSEGSLARSVQKLFQRFVGFAPCLFHGQRWGLLPYRTPITTVVGKPIPVPQVSCPSQETVEQYHQLYMEALETLFHTYKTRCGLSDTHELQII